jgi:predicted glycoside hydrolase/deacetylase ChbG (UPF0249 family)
MTIIINADDFGMSKEINEGILFAHKQGLITSASIMAGPEKNHAIELAKKHKLPCGVHLYGGEKAHLIFIKSLISRKFRNNLRDRFENQILDLKKEIEIKHLDSHKHIHMFPPIFDIVSALAKKHNLRLRLSKKIDISLFNRLGIILFYPRNKKKAKKENIEIINSYGTSHKKLNKLINNVKDGEIIVHPGIINEGGIKRKIELDILLKNKNE